MNKQEEDRRQSGFKKNLTNKSIPLRINIDYTINPKGQWVFTSDYHKRRGYCCKNACLNCPYNVKEIK